MRFRGREMAHRELGMDLLKRVEKDLEEYLKQLQRFGFGPHKGGRVYEIDVEFIATE